MWPVIEKKLAEYLTTHAYPSLRGLKAYDDLFMAGKPDKRKCEAFAQSVVRGNVAGKVSDLQSGIKEHGVTGVPQVEDWNRPLFRAITPGKNNPNGVWWFDAELLQRWQRNIPAGTPNRKQEIMRALRPMLAVSYNWNDFAELQVMSPTSMIPVITGQGAHKPLWDPNPNDPVAVKNHKDTENVFFIGGYKQVYVPLVNPSTTKPYVF